MTKSEFLTSLSLDNPPSTLKIQLKALWWDAKEEWQIAHDLIDHLEDEISAHVHAYLHRVEGDLWNAGYWYRRANRPQCMKTLQEEWEDLLEMYL